MIFNKVLIISVLYNCFHNCHNHFVEIWKASIYCSSVVKTLMAISTKKINTTWIINTLNPIVPGVHLNGSGTIGLIGKVLVVC